MAGMKWWVFNPRLRLALPADMPRLDMDSAVDRGWHLSWLWLPNPEKFLPTRPYVPHHIVVVPQIPRED